MILDVERILELAVVLSLQIAAVTLAAGVAVFLFCRHRPHLAYAIWLVVLVKCLTPPIWSSPTGAFSWALREPRSPPEAPTVPTSRPEPARNDKATPQPPSRTSNTPAPARTAQQSTDRSHSPGAVDSVSPDRSARSVWLYAILGIWVGGTAVVCLLATVRTLDLRRRLRCATQPSQDILSLLAEVAARLGISRGVKVVITQQPLGPALVGCCSPRLVLPAVLLDHEKETALRHVLAHELVHLRRGDLWVRAAQFLAQAIWWFHPLVWWMNFELNRRREQCCDEEVVAGLRCRGAEYAQTLVDLLKLRRSLKPILFSPGVRAMQITTERLAHISRDAATFLPRTPRRVWALAAVLALVVLPGAGIVDETKPQGDRKDAARSAEKKPPAAPERPATKPSSFTLTGTVVDAATNRPIRGATVVIEFGRLHNSKQVGVQAPRMEKRRYSTDEEGTYTIEIPAEAADDANAWVTIRVQHSDYVATETFETMEGRIGGPSFLSRLPLVKGEMITARVETPDGKPLVGFPVRVVAAVKKGTPPRDDRLSMSESEVMTDAEGRFRFNAFTGGTAAFSIAHDKFVPAVRSCGTKRGDQGLVRLQRGSNVSGRVVDTDGRRVTGVWVNVLASFKEDGVGFASAFERAARTDAEGRFALAPLTADTHFFYISNKPCAGEDDGQPRAPMEAAFFTKNVEIKAGDPTPRVEFRAVPHVTIGFRCVDAAGLPAALTNEANVQGEMAEELGWFFPLRETGQGRWEGKAPKGLSEAVLTGFHDGESIWHVRRGADGKLVRLHGDVELGTLDGNVTDVVLVKSPAPALIVKVLDAAGKPRPEVTPRIDYVGREGGTSIIEIVIGQPGSREVAGEAAFTRRADGRWRASELEPNIKFTLTAADHEAVPITLTLGDGETKEIELRLKK
ncbi:MAG: M56 family metallopeptidase [Pirellulales bacterium]